ncbi:integrin beta-7 isoform X8 [Cuculus canorus]|uniref:integrin beta-7 isoform X8 n=1 Tax=Cuculus canorus TaxID=55661 RepID=UPI0023AA2238|nr:integrin beta-7 isoform X8 [Cuculus canorus]
MAGLGGLLLLLLLMARGGHGEDYCDPHESCEECVSAHPQCAWCEETHPPEPLQPHGRGSDPDGTQQLRPSRVQLRLRPREEQSFQVRFRRAQDRPVDIYYLMDLSYSMRDDLENVRKLGSDLLAALRNVTTSVRIGGDTRGDPGMEDGRMGFGSFVDKPVLPFVSTVPSRLRNPCPEQPEPCAPPTAFHHVLSLTDDAEEFAKSVSRQRVSGNLDAAEGGFEAIMQVAVCQERIGWRRATRLLVFASDDVFHSSGDGKLGGIVLPSDSRCHLDAGGRYTKSHIYDYPSVGHLAEVLSAANIHPIFAVTAPTVPTYRELSRLIPKSVVGELRDDSSNVVQLIADAYDSLSSTVELRHSPLPPDVTLTYESHCGDPPDPPSALGGRCTRVAIDQEGLSVASASVGSAAATVATVGPTVATAPPAAPRATACGGALGGPWTVAVLVAAPVVFGVLVLGLCRLSLQLHARRDFRRFQQRRHHHCQPPVPARLRGPHRDPPKISGVPPGTPTQSLGTPKTPPQGCGPPISLWTPIIPGDPPPPITGDP